jgi:hypothetical protein
MVARVELFVAAEAVVVPMAGVLGAVAGRMCPAGVTAHPATAWRRDSLSAWLWARLLSSKLSSMMCSGASLLIIRDRVEVDSVVHGSLPTGSSPEPASVDRTRIILQTGYRLCPRRS